MHQRTVAYRPNELMAVETDVLAAFEDGIPRVTLDLDGLEILDSEGVRGLITLLRRSREVGGEIGLQVSRPDIRRTLAVMALDRLFPVTDGAAA